MHSVTSLVASNETNGTQRLKKIKDSLFDFQRQNENLQQPDQSVLMQSQQKPTL